MIFLDPAGRFYAQWHRAAEAAVANLRQSTGLVPHYPRLREVVRTLAAASEEFAVLWAAQTVQGKSHDDAKELVHPEVGPLSLTYETFDVRGARGQQLVIYHARPHEPHRPGPHPAGHPRRHPPQRPPAMNRRRAG